MIIGVRVSKKKEQDNPYVSRSFCDERFGQFSDRVLEKLNGIEGKVDKIKTKEEKEAEAETRDWRHFLLTIASGVIVAVVVYFIPH